MAFLFKNNAGSTLAAGINASQTTLSVQGGDGANFPAPSGGNTFRATITKASGAFEIVDVTAIAVDVFTIVRNQESSGAKTFLSGDRIELRVTEETLQEFAQINGGIVTANLNADKVDGFEAAAAAAANILLALNGSSKLPASITGDSTSCSGNAATATLASDSSNLGAIAAANYARNDIAQTLTGKQTLNGELELLAGYSEDADATAAGGPITLNTAAATIFYTPVLTSIPTFTFTNPAASGRGTSFTLELNNAANYVPEWPAAVKWSGGDVPIWTTGKDIVTFMTRDGGTTWLGFAGGLAMA